MCYFCSERQKGLAAFRAEALPGRCFCLGEPFRKPAICLVQARFPSKVFQEVTGDCAAGMLLLMLSVLQETMPRHLGFGILEMLWRFCAAAANTRCCNLSGARLNTIVRSVSRGDLCHVKRVLSKKRRLHRSFTADGSSISPSASLQLSTACDMQLVVKLWTGHLGGLPTRGTVLTNHLQIWRIMAIADQPPIGVLFGCFARRHRDGDSWFPGFIYQGHPCPVSSA